MSENGGHKLSRSVYYYTPGSNANFVTLREESNYDAGYHGCGDVRDVSVTVKHAINCVDSYAKHMARPFTAAEEDTLGIVLKLLDDLDDFGVYADGEQGSDEDYKLAESLRGRIESILDESKHYMSRTAILARSNK